MKKNSLFSVYIIIALLVACSLGASLYERIKVGGIASFGQATQQPSSFLNGRKPQTEDAFQKSQLVATMQTYINPNGVRDFIQEYILSGNSEHVELYINKTQPIMGAIEAYGGLNGIQAKEARLLNLLSQLIANDAEIMYAAGEYWKIRKSPDEIKIKLQMIKKLFANMDFDSDYSRTKQAVLGGATESRPAYQTILKTLISYVDTYEGAGEASVRELAHIQKIRALIDQDTLLQADALVDDVDYMQALQGLSDELKLAVYTRKQMHVYIPLDHTAFAHAINSLDAMLAAKPPLINLSVLYALFIGAGIVVIVILAWKTMTTSKEHPNLAATNELQETLNRLNEVKKEAVVAPLTKVDAPVKEDISPLQGNKYILVDASKASRSGLSKYLTSLGMELSAEFGDISSALKAISSGLDGGAPAIIISDIMTDGEAGYQFATKLSELSEYANIPVLALSSEMAPGLIKRIKSAGFAGLIRKPIIKAKLKTTLLNLLT
ncbi:MAG: CheY-like chemotaxis protein [Candidatus Omnitrophota bacterium]|jgi:CheY-like chemotaxis protein